SCKQRHPARRVGVLRDQYELSESVSSFRVGANSYLAKISTSETLIKSLELVMLGVTFLPPEILALISDRRARNRRVASEGHADVYDDVEFVGAHAGLNKW